MKIFLTDKKKFGLYLPFGNKRLGRLVYLVSDKGQTSFHRYNNIFNWIGYSYRHNRHSLIDYIDWYNPKEVKPSKIHLEGFEKAKESLDKL